MRDIELWLFLKQTVPGLRVSDLAQQIGVAENTLRNRWKSEEKRKEVIHIVAGILADNGELVKKLINEYY